MEVDQPIFDAAAVLADASSDDGEIQGEQSLIDVGNLAVFSYELPEGESHKQTATRLAQLLINQVFTLPVERSDVGPLALLPRPKIPIPREKPVCARPPSIEGLQSGIFRTPILTFFSRLLDPPTQTRNHLGEICS